MLNERSISRLRAIDWDFPGSASESPFSAIHWHPARLPSQIVATFIGVLTQPNDLIVDPFVGSGTTAVEAQRLGRKFVGIDLNPVSCLITRAKTLSSSAGRIAALVNCLRDDAECALRGRLGSPAGVPCAPETVQKKWYTPRVLGDLALLWATIGSYKGRKKMLAESAFSAVLLPVCRETRHWGYVCDNTTPKGSHEGDVLSEYSRVLGRLAGAYHERDEDRSILSQNASPVLPVEILCGDCREALRDLQPESVDLVITSPPYFGVSDYIKSQRLTAEWFGIQIEPLRKIEIGARSKRHRLTAAKEYVGELENVFGSITRLLKPTGACVVVIGESSSRASLLKRVRKAMRSAGLNIALQAERTVSQQRRQHASINTETLLISGVRERCNAETARFGRTRDNIVDTAEVLSSSG
jgi:DNA modification methylase